MRITGEPEFGLTVRRWSTAELDAARHRPELTAGDRVHVIVDLAQHGIGSGSCGPGTLPRYELRAGQASIRLRFDPV